MSISLPSAPLAPHKWLRAVRALWGILAIYLPLMMMGGLALATYWLYRNTPSLLAVNDARAERHDADYFMRSFALRALASDGALKSEVRGRSMRHFPDTDTLEIEQVHIRLFDKRQLLTTATATKAISNADGSQVQLMGGAQVVREEAPNASGTAQPRFVLEGEFLHVFVNTERVLSHKPVVVIRGKDRIEAGSLDFNYLDRTATFTGRVNATLGGHGAAR